MSERDVLLGELESSRGSSHTHLHGGRLRSAAGLLTTLAAAGLLAAAGPRLASAQQQGEATLYLPMTMDNALGSQTYKPPAMSPIPRSVIAVLSVATSPTPIRPRNSRR